MGLDNKNLNESKPKIKIALGWGGWGLWGFLILFFGQNTWASLYENETRAAIIYAAFTLLLFFGGVIVHFSRRFNDL